MATWSRSASPAPSNWRPRGTLTGLVKRQLKGVVDHYHRKTPDDLDKAAAALTSTGGRRRDRLVPPERRRRLPRQPRAGHRQRPARRIVTNDDLSQIMDTNDEWIRDRVGIVERRLRREGRARSSTWPSPPAPTRWPTPGVDPSEVDTVIVPTCTMPTQIPNAAAQVADRSASPAPGAFDLNAACAGFCYALGVASDLIRAGSAKKVLVIGAEKFTDWVDPIDRANAIIFADGAGAAVVGASDEPRIGPVVLGQRRRPGRPDRA